MVLGFGTITEIMNSPNAEMLRGFAEELKKEMHAPYYQRAIKQAGERWVKSYKEEEFKKLEGVFKQIESDIGVFEKKKRRGRPKVEKQRGRPKLE